MLSCGHKLLRVLKCIILVPSSGIFKSEHYSRSFDTTFGSKAWLKMAAPIMFLSFHGFRRHLVNFSMYVTFEISVNKFSFDRFWIKKTFLIEEHLHTYNSYKIWIFCSALQRNVWLLLLQPPYEFLLYSNHFHLNVLWQIMFFFKK